MFQALQQLGVSAEASGRNDLTVSGRKVSGAAFKHSLHRSLHHGTLLVDLDLTALAKYLNPNKVFLARSCYSSSHPNELCVCLLIGEVAK